MKEQIRNAQIVDTMLGREDHGIMTFYIYVTFGGSHVGIGGYSLDYYDRKKDCRVFRAASMEAISRILDVVGVSSWENLKGNYIRIKDNGSGSTIDEIGNLMKDIWFNVREFFEAAKEWS